MGVSKKYLIFIFVFSLVCLTSCICLNLQEARRVLNYSPKDTNISALIRIDGYYYHKHYDVDIQNNTELRKTVFVLSENSRFKRLGSYDIRDGVYESIRNSIASRPYNGYYTISGDTIKTRWVGKFGLCAYDIYSEQFVVLNDTTLQRIWFWCDTCSPHRFSDRDPIRNEIYRFREFRIDAE